jgi:hypothetical protein
MKDAALHLEINPPAAGQSVSINPMDLGIDQPGFSNQWRLGRLRIAWPALPNLTSTSDNLTVTLQDSPDGVTFANTGSANSPATPNISVTITGVANTGVAAGYVDVALPPGTRGPIGLLVSASAGAGNNTAALLTADWLNE